MPMALLLNGKVYSIVTDQLGTPTEAYNVEGEEVWHRRLDMNGKILEEVYDRNVPYSDRIRIPFLFQEQYCDHETGLAYNRFRYYDPEIGRYISEDPIRFNSGTTALHSYVEDSNDCVDFYGLKTYRRKNGQFGKKPGRKKKHDSSHGNSIHSKKPWQHYVIVDDQGRVYHGVGDIKGKRAKQSLRRLSEENPDRVFSIQNQRNYSNSFEALKAEARGIRDSGGAGESNLGNYNVRNSPGSKYI